MKNVAMRTAPLITLPLTTNARGLRAKDVTAQLLATLDAPEDVKLLRA